MSPTPEQTFVLTKSQLQGIANYLGTRPYAEVVEFFNLLQSLQPQALPAAAAPPVPEHD